MIRRSALCFSALLMTGLAGCGLRLDVPVNSSGGATMHADERVSREKVAKAEFVEVALHLGAGGLNLEGGAKDFFEGSFDYSVAAWKPTVTYDGSSFRGRLTVKQGSGSGTFGNIRNEWKLKLANDIPIDLKVNCGAGENHLDLRELNLRRVEAHMGAGSVEMDLRDQSQRNLEVKVEGGVGEATIRVPKNVGVIAEASGGLGSINVTGMEKDGNRWKNEAYGKAKPTMRISVHGGIGEINIKSE